MPNFHILQRTRRVGAIFIACILALLVLTACLAALPGPAAPGATPDTSPDTTPDTDPASTAPDPSDAPEGTPTDTARRAPGATATTVPLAAVPDLPTLAPGRLLTQTHRLRATPATPNVAAGAESDGAENDDSAEENPDAQIVLLPTVTPTPGRVARLRATPGVTPTATPNLTTPTPQATPPDDAQGVTNAPVVNLRGGPGTNYPVQGQARAQDDPFAVVGRTRGGDWLQICCPTDGETPVWISAQFVDVALPAGAALAELPVPEIPPTPVPPTPAPVAAGAGNAAANLANAPAAGLPGPGGFGAPGGTNPLTGRPLPEGRAAQRPLIVCINNDFAARPQIGTAQADIMYEYLMEGYGITRMSGVYYGSEAGQIGPARSARLINYYLGALYDAGLACTGASDPVRYTLKHEAPFPYLDFDLDDPNASRYSSSVGTDYRTRMRTSTTGLRRWLAEWGVEKAPALRSFTFGGVPGGGAPATSVAIPYPAGTGSQSAYVYRDGRYWRSMGGGAHVDGATGAQLAYENVIVQYVTHQATDIVEDSLGSTSIRLNLFGSNRAIVFRDGQAFVGIWRSESRGDLPRFYDAAGNEIPLKPGRTFFSIVPESYTITYR